MMLLDCIYYSIMLLEGDITRKFTVVNQVKTQDSFMNSFHPVCPLTLDLCSVHTESDSVPFPLHSLLQTRT